MNIVLNLLVAICLLAVYGCDGSQPYTAAVVEMRPVFYERMIAAKLFFIL